MSIADPQDAQSIKGQRTSLWLKELPFTLVLVLTIVGVAYTSVSKQPIVGYWEALAPIIALVCIGAGWEHESDRAGRIRLIATQSLHWLAFVAVMHLIMLPGVQKLFTVHATGLAIFTLLTLGTFTAGLQIRSWQICLLGVIMALAIPAIAWIENSALMLVLIAAAALGIAAVFWRHWHET